MIWARILWAGVLAVLLAFTFRRAWRWEHGAEADVLFSARWGRETHVFVPPTVLFWILLCFLLLFLVQLGVPEGLTRFAALAADVLLFLSAYFLLLPAILPLLRRHISARACAVLWLVPAFLFWQANILFSVMPLPRRTLYIPGSAAPLLAGIWSAGFLAVGGYYLVSHLRFRATIRTNGAPEQNDTVLALLRRIQEELDYRRPVKLLRCDVPAPFSMGQTKRSRCLVLPRRDYAPEELSMIFRHELHHLQRCDVDTKVFFCLCNAFCWFNPLVWLATRRAAEDLERSCDEIVVEDMDESARKRYAHLLLDAAAPIPGCTTCLSAAAGTLRYRLKSVVETKRRPLGTLLLALVLFCSVMSFGYVSVSDARGSFSELLLPEGTEIRSAVATGVSHRWDSLSVDEALYAAIDAIELEHVAGLRSPAIPDRSLTLVLSDGRFVDLTEQCVVIRNPRGAGDCYLIKGGMDLDEVIKTLHFG